MEQRADLLTRYTGQLNHRGSKLITFAASLYKSCTLYNVHLLMYQACLLFLYPLNVKVAESIGPRRPRQKCEFKVFENLLKFQQKIRKIFSFLCLLTEKWRHE